jgi:hypothetical protein
MTRSTNRRADNQADFAGPDADREAIERLARAARLANEQRGGQQGGRRVADEVLQRFEERQRRKERCRAMLDAQVGAKRPKPFQRERESVRVRTSRDAFRRIGNIAKAALYERRLAEIETRATEAWAVDAPAGGGAP